MTDGKIAMTNIVFDVRPLEQDTDLAAMEDAVRAITIEGLTWGSSQLVEMAYGLKKLQISCKVVDDLVCTDDIEEQIMAQEDLVSSVDVAIMTL